MQNKKNLVILTILFFIFAILFYAKTGNIFVDFSRESYIPFQIINGKKLLKDIFLIYGPFGYLFNCLLYFIKVNVNILIIEANLISYCILILFYFILNKFFTSKVSLTFSIIFLLISIFSNSTFSFVLPYSFSSLWAVLGIYLVLFSLLYDKKNILFLSLGLIFANKIEFFIPAFLASIFFLIYKKEKFIKNFSYIFVFPILCLIYYALNHITLDDFLKNYFYLKKMIQTESIKYLYKGMGAFFNKDYFIYSLKAFLKFFCVFLFSHFLYIIKKPFISYLALIILLFFVNLNFSLNLIAFFSAILTFFAWKKKNISNDEIIFLIFALILSTKSIFAINSLGYSNFSFCLLVFYTFLQLQKFVNKKWLINSIIIFFIFNFVSNLNFFFRENKRYVKTKVGFFALKNDDIKLFKDTNLFIQKNIKKDENFLVLPEGQIFNLIHKKTYNFYNSTFTPLDFETFKDGELKSQLKKNQVDYIIFYPRNTEEYGKQGICFDYAVDFCNYIVDNYTQVAKLKSEKQVIIFKIKK